MRKIKFYSISLLLICSCAKNNATDGGMSTRAVPTIYVQKSSESISFKNDTILYANEKYSGYLYELNPENKDTISIEGFFGGVQSGVSKKWYASNKLMEQRHYRNGKKNGKQIAYWENGNKKFDFTAINDAYEGELKEWNVEGKLIHLANYKNGQESGTQKLWYDNGKIRANYVIINGRRYGLLGTKNCKNVSDSIFVSK